MVHWKEQVVKEVGNSNFFTEEFVKYNSRDCKLLLEFTNQGFAYTIFQLSSNTILYTAVADIEVDWFTAETNKIEAAFKKEDVFNFTFSEVLVLANFGISTLVPKVYFKDVLKEKYLSHSYNLPKVEYTVKDVALHNINYQLIYLFPLNIEQYLTKNVLNLKIQASEAEVLNFLQAKNVSLQYANVHIGMSQMHFAYFENKTLHFSNTYTYQSNEDLLYNVLNVYKQLGLNTEKVVLNLSGIISKPSTLYDLLYKYIKYISFQNRPLKLNYADRLNEMPAHYFMHHYVAFL